MENIRKKIGVIDANNENIYLLNALYNTFKNCDILYFNIDTVEKYEGLDDETLVNDTQCAIQYLISKNIDIIVFASDTIIEYYNEKIEELKVPYILITECSINYINENYEYKNLGFMACTSVIEANLYQKYFRYNHLYNMTSDSLTETIKKFKVKTSESFQETRLVVAPVAKKGLDIIIPSSVNYLMLKTEICEFLKEVDILPIDEVICNNVSSLIFNSLLPAKGKTKVFILTKEIMAKDSFAKYMKCDYKLFNINEKKCPF